MNIKEIKAFQTSDGKLHHSTEDAEAHEVELELSGRYENNPIYDDWGSTVPFKNVLDFIVDNADLIRRML